MTDDDFEREDTSEELSDGDGGEDWDEHIRGVLVRTSIVGVSIILALMFVYAWFTDYGHHPIEYQTVEVVDDSGYMHDCVVFTHGKGVAVDCTHPDS